ncbi:hypothetical protein [Streptomyces profundus]|uniref:hypothetical protein n=1 Tax=Streptomyces profundus TaxID=2867410 RepID=UPI001D160726|nr:hypothetical protein [Streptomyces sp. MA3_2.13]UED84349.1 hypothetical protein K4G22_09135 [Streptomyces sp. MA3_2.13]
MSRETDNPPNPRGWGDPHRNEGDGEARPGPPPAEEKKTETTMTTRARINIPGSRPIPPIVVRETVDDEAVRAAPPPPLPTRNKPGSGPRAESAGRPAQGAPASAAGDPGKKTSSWFEPRKPPATGAMPQVDAQGRQEAPSDDGPPTPPGGHPQFSDTPPEGVPGVDQPPGTPAWFGGSSDGPPAVTPQGPLPPRPVGPTTGPAAGTMAVPPVPGQTVAPHSGAPAGFPPDDPAPRPGGIPPQAVGHPPPVDDPVGTTMDLGGPFPPAPPKGLGAESDLTATGALPSPFASDDPASSGSGPAVPPPGPRPEPGSDGERPPAEPKAAKAAPRGRSKVKLLVVAVVGLGVIAYGAGLFLNPEDVSKGTTVLGAEIGGMSTQEAQSHLESRLDAANNEPLILLIDGQEVELKPSVAGLAVDTEATARAASGTDYSPVAVIGSLFGSAREVDAVFSVDREKLTVALADVTAGAGGNGPVDGTVVFEGGQAIGRAGQAGSAIDPQGAADAVEAAFRERAAGDGDSVVELPVTTQEPLVGEEQVAQALAEFGEPAMSGWVWLSAAGVELPMSPDTLTRVLSMEPSDQGNLQPVIDPDALAEVYGSTFDGVLIDAGSGLVEMTPEHAAAALIPALREAAVADDGPDRRVAEVEGATFG